MTQPNERENFSQAETVIRLQEAIEQLNSIVSQLNTGTGTVLLPKVAVDNLLNSTQQLAAALKPDEFAEVEQSLTPDSPIEAAEGIDDILPDFEQVEGWWTAILNKIRRLLPGGISEKIPDWLITGLLTGSLVTILLVAVISLPKNTGEIAENMPEPSPSPAAGEIIATPPELTAPEAPIPVPITKAKPRLTPEQSLVAAIQQEITDLTTRYPTGIISTVEADFLASRLVVILGDNWYGLEASQQDKLANSVFQRCQSLDFRRLEMKDNEGILLARSPVVGDRVVIVNRSQPSAAISPGE
ncbi:conserved hypothetical protein [Microcystis aeruginosa PCC 9806]|uniref:Uncharacterized protein n=2 Tax=Microcystis TaxID=1125 RepID=A0A552M2B8_9CHRO|nr:hypothetical protein [Microcystis aeruginosa]TRV26612.1 MAG: hypothetical protein EWV40_02745 [Microcystis flos-aquae Mf_WU_F_19750830_S460]CCI13955.1 conserved hypothetical protein [Microcystis aeruginosa PCC 9806]